MSEQELLYQDLDKHKSLKEVQEYIRNVIQLRGFDKQSIETTMLLMSEEVGELAKAIRKDATNMRIDQTRLENYDSIESEVADIFIVLVSICNKLGIDLFTALKEKEAKNTKRVWSK